MKNLLYILSFWCVSLGILCSCSDDDFSTSAADQPRFSVDTLSFDTVITTVGSSTKQVMLYNPGDKPLLIGPVYLKSGGTSGFRVNVDGSPGTEFNEIELNKKDSLYIFVEVKAPVQHSDDPQLVQDELVVTTNGVTRTLVLKAYGQDALMWRGRTLEHDTVLTSGKPLVIYDSLSIAEGVTLVCDPGARLMFHSQAQLKVHGTLVTNGEPHRRVIFRGDRMDRLFPYLPYDRTPGQWEGIRFYSTSMNNRLTGANIHSANTAIRCDSSDRASMKLSLVSSVVENSAYMNLNLKGCRAEIVNCLIDNSGLGMIRLADGDYRMLHCTAVNKYAFAARQGKDMQIYSSFKEGNGIDSTRVDLLNCLFASKDVFDLGGNKNGISLKCNTIPSDYDTQSYDDIHYIYLNNDGDYRYNFHPTAENACIGAANPLFAREVPYDLDGYPRVQDGAPDNGCYEYHESN